MCLTRATIVVLALSIGADGAYSAVVYTNPVDVLVTENPVYVDLNGDGTDDFQLYYGFASGWGSFVSVGPYAVFAGNAVGSDSPGLYTTAYDIGAVFGAGETMRLEPSMAIFHSVGGVVQGGWATIGAEHFAGVRLQKDGRYHYGWIRIRNISGVTGMYLLDFAYETNPDQSIVIGAGLPVRADINGDGVVNVQDLLLLLAAWGPCPGCPEDINGDGEVNISDLLELLAAWGP